MRQGREFQLPTTFCCRVLLFHLCARHWAKWVSYIISHVLWPPYGKNIFLALFFRWGKRDSERLNNLPKVTELMNGRARNQIQSSLFMTAHYFFSNKLFLRYRVLKVENVCFSYLSFKQPLNNFHDDIFFMFIKIDDPGKGVAYKFIVYGVSLVAQWLRIHLPMQGTRVRALVRKDPTCHRATKPERHNCWGCAVEFASQNYWAHVLQLLKSAQLEPVLRDKRSHCNEKPTHHNEE